MRCPACNFSPSPDQWVGPSNETLRCPACGARATADCWVGADTARTMHQWLLAVPHGLVGHVVRYLALFRSATSDLPHTFVIELLTELVPVMQTGLLQSGDQTHTIHPAAWSVAFDQMQSQRSTISQLKSHRFLWKVVIAVAKEIDVKLESEREFNRRMKRSSTSGFLTPLDAIQERINTEKSRAQQMFDLGHDELAHESLALVERMKNQMETCNGSS